MTVVLYVRVLSSQRYTICSSKSLKRLMTSMRQKSALTVAMTLAHVNLTKTLRLMKAWAPLLLVVLLAQQLVDQLVLLLAELLVLL